MLKQELLTACQICLRILLKLSRIINNFFRHWRSSRRFSFVETASSKKSVDYISIVIFLELLNYGIWPDILTYIHLQNTPKRLVQQNKPFPRYSLPSRKTKFSYVNTKNFEKDCFVVLNLDPRELLWKPLKW